MDRRQGISTAGGGGGGSSAGCGDGSNTGMNGGAGAAGRVRIDARTRGGTGNIDPAPGTLTTRCDG